MPPETRKDRVEEHNAGTTPASSRYAPWKLLWVGGFLDKYVALEFEAYLKSGSGRAFTAKHLIPNRKS
ncbi:MAG: GIY-YIG nuclease family protein [Candidatus Marinimicrobia bacterium]|nr:GIY-YIG nuclease family protein [Candidatus Neomarinimicrobiota bacterium]